MVEARGFEPLSEDNATQASTGVVTVLMSPIYKCGLRTINVNSTKPKKLATYIK